MRGILLASVMLAAAPALAQPEQLAPTLPPMLSLREQASVRDRWTAERLDTIVPALMREQGIDMWVLIAREYLEDPVLATMLDARSLRARRRTILVFHDPGGGRPVERLTVSRYGVGNLFQPAWVPETQPDQWRRLAELIAERNPSKIAVNVSAATAFGDGLTQSQYQAFTAALSPELRSRIVPGEDLAVGWLETRTPAEMSRYPEIVRTAHAIIGEGFSNRVVKPGATTAQDLAWWFRERIAELKLATWFHPSVAIFRQGVAQELGGDEVIRAGDMLWVDFGIMHLGLATDTQHLAYVLKPGETDAPAGLKAGLAAANRVQDAVTSSFSTGLSGNQILADARAKALAQGLNPNIYSHPIGYHGHGAGAAIGFWDDQNASERGTHKLRPNTAWSIELSQTQAVPEWGGQVVQFRTEEDAFFDGRSVHYLDGRQTRFHLIGDR
ncbi:aminopeptidase P family protein [Sphingomonas sp. ID1715]|uniref:M24 family metallopeptidase n=1 Tax=Sphingomonas sp. ID1715 TaxID=1656898 RepID=UPI001488A4C3|nr:M24 family metallopeptidase [Sphingomonas sp. ID1715]NNM78099.1 aminopeptidase P family protein [Sphingomonas sp. ID1715]